MKKKNEKTSDTESASDDSDEEKKVYEAKILAESSSSLADYSTSGIDSLYIKEQKKIDKEMKKEQIRRMKKLNKLIKEKKLNRKKKEESIKFLDNPIKKIKEYFQDDEKSIKKLLNDSSLSNSDDKHKKVTKYLEIISKLVGIIIALIGAYYSFFKRHY